MNINDAIKIMKMEVTDSIAQHYLKSIEESIEEFGTYGLAVQLSYVMCNVSKWRNGQAKEVKAFVRKWIKEKIEYEKHNNIPTR